MSNDREAFEKWANEYALHWEPLPETLQERKKQCYAAWKAAKDNSVEPVAWDGKTEHDPTPIINAISSRLKNGDPGVVLSRDIARQLLNEIDSYHSWGYKVMERKLRECQAAKSERESSGN